ncbi:hypothetical protein PYCC9005_000345 [Savitreella phatthalungensis]
MDAAKVLDRLLLVDSSVSFVYLRTKATLPDEGESSAADVFTDKHRAARHLLVATQHDKIVYAAELYTYSLEDNLTTIYVSKVDTTGSHDRSKSPIGALTQMLLAQAVSCNVKGNDVRILLFARSQSQYIFPASIDNKKKHVLDDGGLVRWWIRQFTKMSAHLSTRRTRGWLLMPGCELADTKRYLGSSSDACNWQIGHPYKAKSKAKDVVLKLDDDPKARFLDELEDDGELEKCSIESFWERMAYRQEMSSGHTIGFIALDVEQQEDIENPVQVETIVSDDVYDKVKLKLETETYADDEETAEVTTKWIACLREACPHVKWVQVNGCRQADAADVPINGRPADASTANILQPRKRERTDRSDAVSANVLIPRKKNK